MDLGIDTSVLVAAMIESENNHEACRELILNHPTAIYSHGIVETFATLTGGREPFRTTPEIAASLIQGFLSRVRVVTLSPALITDSIQDSQSRGVRGGAMYDFLHLVAAREIGLTRFCTLNMSHFEAFHRGGDPMVIHP